MSYYFDAWGYLTNTVNSSRETTVEPPAQNQWPFGQMPRWSGTEWLFNDYPPPELLESAIHETRDGIIREIYAHAKSLLDYASYLYSDAEKATWNELEKECIEYQSSQTIGRFMQYEIDCGYSTASEIATRVLNKANAFHPYRAEVVAIRSQAIQAVLAMNPVELFAIEVTTDFEWPVFEYEHL